MYNLTDRNIILGVSGSIAAYKAADLASKLTQAGARLDVVLTPVADATSPIRRTAPSCRRVGDSFLAVVGVRMDQP